MATKHGQHTKEVYAGEVIQDFRVPRHGWIWWDEVGLLGESKVYRSQQAAERALAQYCRDVLGHRNVEIPPLRRSPASKLPSILVRFPTQKDRERVQREARRANKSLNAYCLIKLIGNAQGSQKP